MYKGNIGDIDYRKLNINQMIKLNKLCIGMVDYISSENKKRVKYGLPRIKIVDISDEIKEYPRVNDKKNNI